MANTEPSSHFIEAVTKIVREASRPIRIAEIGVDRGATTKAILQVLRSGDEYDLFDLDCPLFKEFSSLENPNSVKINRYENTRATFDSYAWMLAKLLEQRFEGGIINPLWDAVYLDGAHVFHVDAPATAVIKELIKPHGLIVFDDVRWSLASSPTCSKDPTLLKKYTKEQIQACHVELIINSFMRTDPRFVERNTDSASRAFFQRI
jgi:hypothetical protein